MSVDVTIFNFLESVGVFTILLPWLFTFSVIYGLLAKTNLFGDNTTKISGIVALVMAFISVPFAGPWFAIYFTNITIGAVIILLGLIVFLLFISAVGISYEDFITGEKTKAGMIILFLIIVGYMVYASLGGSLAGNIGNLNLRISETVVQTIVFLAILLGGIGFVLFGGGSKPSNGTPSPQQPTK